VTGLYERQVFCRVTTNHYSEGQENSLLISCKPTEDPERWTRIDGSRPFLGTGNLPLYPAGHEYL